ncbi:MAG: hypothetical protein AAF633_14695, partial [Chloroflexota bacterium]
MTDQVSAGHTLRYNPSANSMREDLKLALNYLDDLMQWAVVRARKAGLGIPNEFQGLYISDDQVQSLLDQSMEIRLWSDLEYVSPEEEALKNRAAHSRKVWRQQTGEQIPLGERSLTNLAQQFSLSELELDAILMCLASDIDPKYERIYGYLQDDINKRYPSINFVLDCISKNFDEKIRARALFTSHSLLSRFNLIEQFQGHQSSILSTRLSPAASLVHWIVGGYELDPKLKKFARLEHLTGTSTSQDELRSLQKEQPMVIVTGAYGSGKRDLAKKSAVTAGYKAIIWIDLSQPHAETL